MSNNNWLKPGHFRWRPGSKVRAEKGMRPGTVIYSLEEPAPTPEPEEPNIDTTELFRRKNYRVE